MRLNFRGPRARPAWVVLPLLAAGWVTGCVQNVPDIDASTAIAEATALSEPIRFSTEAGPLDVPIDGDLTTLTRTDAVRRALQNSPAVQAALADVRAALAEAKQARVLANPVLSVTFRLSEGSGNEVIEAGLSQSLIDLLRRPARARAADARLRSAAARAVGEALDVLQEIERTYAEAQAADSQLALLDQQQSLLRQLQTMTEARRQAGEAGQLDVLGLQARQAALDVETRRQRANRQALRLTLTRLVGQPSGAAEWQLEPLSPPPPPPPPVVEASESQWLALALQNRPAVQAAIFELAALGQEVRLASLEPFDDLAAGVELESEETVSAGPAASGPIPIFDWGQHRRARASAEVIAARHELTALRRQMIEDVRQALAAAEAARTGVAAIEDRLLPLQRERLEQTRAAYRAGFADLFDVLQVEQELLDARHQLIDARLRQQRAAVNLKRAVGGATTPTTQPTTQPTTTTRNSP